MEDSRKWPESETGGGMSEELRAFLEVSDDEGACEFSPDVPIEEELVEEIMQQLWEEIKSDEKTSSFPAVGSNKESCGASFSDSAWTVMAGVEVSGGAYAGGGGGDGGGGDGGGTCVEDVKGWGEKMEGCDGKEADDEWLTNILSWGAQVLIDD